MLGQKIVSLRKIRWNSQILLRFRYDFLLSLNSVSANVMSGQAQRRLGKMRSSDC